MTSPTISVAMCTFNGARFVDAQLESLAAQKRLPDELVVCDDRSSDNTCETITRFARRARFAVRLVINDKNLGTTKNFEKSIQLCHGPIIALADQDDVWYPHKLDEIENALTRSDVIAVFSDADLITEDSRPLTRRLWRTLRFTRAEQKQFARGNSLEVLIRHPIVTGATMAFRKELFELVTPLPPDESHDRWIAFLLAGYGRIESIPQPLMQYRQHRAQQIGPGPLTIRGKMAVAKARAGDFYCEELRRFRELHNHIQQRQHDFAGAKHIEIEIEEKIVHLQHRAELAHGKIARIPKILHHALNGNYWRYSGGWRSIAKDLLLRE
jgi:glycosyltransferase involved in cell wall biosynthesis